MAALTAPLLAGCSGGYLRVYRYSDHTVIEAWPPSLIDDFCSAEAGKWDDGRPKKKGASVGGCFEQRPTIWVKSRAALIHEERHFDCWKNPRDKSCLGHPEKEGYK